MFTGDELSVVNAYGTNAYTMHAPWFENAFPVLVKSIMIIYSMIICCKGNKRMGKLSLTAVFIAGFVYKW